ncbi:MAG: PqqD family protein, partial [Candidatus Marinimicrobia bacterium]|nr:PqqD family protein [Candidatus Neomarinimicrobiota bacterium]
MNKIDLEYQPATRPDLLFRELNDGGVVYEYHSGALHSLNTTAAYIWSLCDGKHTVAEIIISIKQNFTRFETDPTSEVIKIIEKFQTLNL